MGYNMIKKTTSRLTDERNHFKPFNYPWAYEAWLKHEQSHWLHTEVPMLEDVKDWKKKLTVEEKQFLTHIFRFFTQGDIDVAGGYVKNYLPHFPQPEVRMMLIVLLLLILQYSVLSPKGCNYSVPLSCYLTSLEPAK
jgi:ribonucleoside-diphosphate reductase beta chain